MQFIGLAINQHLGIQLNSFNFNIYVLNMTQLAVLGVLQANMQDLIWWRLYIFQIVDIYNI